MGRPIRSMVGEAVSRAAWLLVQYADRDPAFQRRCLGLLAAAAAAGEVRPRDVAYLTDLDRLTEGRLQEIGNLGHRTRWALGPASPARSRPCRRPLSCSRPATTC
jgi:hypothetical protein